MTDILQLNLENIAELLRKDWDWVVCYDGYERTGKSTLAMQTAIMVDKHFEDYGLDHVVFDWTDLTKAAKDAPSYSAIWYDEARMLTRERLKPWNIAMVRTLSIVGFKKHFFEFNFPDFWELDPYIKDHRCRTRGLVQSFHGERGFAHFWASQKRAFKSKKGRSTWWEPAFNYRFSSFEDRRSDWYEYRHLWREYVKVEQEAKTSILDDSGIDYREQIIKNLLGKGHPQRVIADAIGLSRPRVSRIIKDMRESNQLPQSST